MPRFDDGDLTQVAGDKILELEISASEEELPDKEFFEQNPPAELFRAGIDRHMFRKVPREKSAVSIIRVWLTNLRTNWISCWQKPATSRSISGIRLTGSFSIALHFQIRSSAFAI